MAYIIKMPKLGMGMNQGTLLKWFVLPGEAVSDEDPIAEIESEKTVAEITASEDGVLRRVYVSEGETVNPGAVLGIVADSDIDIDDLEEGIDRDPIDVSMAETTSGVDPTPVSSEHTDTSGGGSPSNRIRASPKARRRADELGITLSMVEGSGPQGAIILADVEEAKRPRPDSGGTATSADATPKARRRARDQGLDLTSIDGSGPNGAVTSADLDSVGETEAGDMSSEQVTTPETPAERSLLKERELSGMRRTIADRLSQSYREAVHVTVHRNIDMEAALTATATVDDHLDADTSVIDLVLIALSATLNEYPAFNATFEDGVHRIHEQQNIGIAVDVEDGLITPVLSDVGDRSLADLVGGRREITDCALSGDYTTADLSGGTITISNLGVFGINSFTPIINPPEVAILGIDSIEERPVRDGESIDFRRFGGFDLTFDHRVVDGADAARFLDMLADHLTNPWPLLLNRA